MAIKIQNSTIIDDSRNIVNAGIGTFVTSINVGTSGTIFSAANKQLNENILSVNNVNNVSALEVTGIGSVGIGTSNPSTTLHINGNGLLVSSGSTTVFSANSYDQSGRILSVTSLTNSPAMEITGIGSVGIGTTLPSKTFHVEGNGLLVSSNNKNLLSVESFNISNPSIFEVLDDSNNKIIGVTSNTFAVSNPLQQILKVDTANSTENIFSVVNQNNASALEVTGIGSVGIGISTPTKALHVNGNGILISTDSTSIFSVDTLSTGNNSFEVLDVSGNLAFQVSGVGSVGIGTSLPQKALHVSGTGMLVSTGSTTILSVDTISNDVNTFEILNDTGSVILGVSTNIVSMVGTIGSVGIGTTLPRNKLEIQGDFTSLDTRVQSISQKSSIINGNTVSLVYNTGGGNIAICTNPSGPITLAITGIPTDNTFNNRTLYFSIIVMQSSVGYSCSTVTLNGVTEIVKYPNQTVLTGSSNCYDIFNFIGINTIGSASTTANYDVLSYLTGNIK